MPEAFQRNVTKMDIQSTKIYQTERVVDQILKKIVKWKHNDLTDWPMDTKLNKDIKIGLSHGKLVNEINHRELRSFSEENIIRPLPICGSSTGRHSYHPSNRLSDLQGLGIGINLYLKLLKYLQCMFFVHACM